MKKVVFWALMAIVGVIGMYIEGSIVGEWLGTKLAEAIDELD